MQSIGSIGSYVIDDQHKIPIEGRLIGMQATFRKDGLNLTTCIKSLGLIIDQIPNCEQATFVVDSPQDIMFDFAQDSSIIEWLIADLLMPD